MGEVGYVVGLGRSFTTSVDNAMHIHEDSHIALDGMNVFWYQKKMLLKRKRGWMRSRTFLPKKPPAFEVRYLAMVRSAKERPYSKLHPSNDNEHPLQIQRILVNPVTSPLSARRFWTDICREKFWERSLFYRGGISSDCYIYKQERAILYVRSEQTVWLLVAMNNCRCWRFRTTSETWKMTCPQIRGSPTRRRRIPQKRTRLRQQPSTARVAWEQRLPQSLE